ncbi:caspase-3-like [Melitaea cinxia]|uniref:caspase-3-like n=1 Tax=Melitaea cinxia TaxID=113334 RepID=UPI001E271D9A|nr:caspase-3-like [Melitaea cinxia]
MDQYSYTELDGVMKNPPEVSYESDSKSEYNEDKTSEPVTPISESVNVLYNTRALSRHATTYKLEKFEKNFMIIFNQENIVGYEPRLGTEKDVASLCSTFSEFGFECVVRTDYTKAEIMEELQVLKEKDFTDYGCVAVVVLTHGSSGGLLKAKDTSFHESEIVNFFKTHDKPTLATKAKLLIVQACRGKKPIRAIYVGQAAKISKDEDDRADEPYTLPIESDMLILHSSYRGNPSHRDELHGSWLIQTLCTEIKRNSPRLDLESILTDVKRKVAIDFFHAVYNKGSREIDINKQMPVVTSTLIRKLYFKKFNDEPSTPEVFSDRGTMGQNEVLDSETPQTPTLLPRFGPCFCFLDHFSYLKKCLRHLLAENPEDMLARSYLNLCDTFDDNVDFNAAKEKMATLISLHLKNYEGTVEFFKYLHLYETRP